MSKEFVATLITMITGFIAILAFLWAISSEIGEIKGELGVLSGMVNQTVMASLSCEMMHENCADY